jgi:antitoxin component of MazEF toxin-antitoxin module
MYVVTTTIGKWGNSAGVGIPQEFLKCVHLTLGTKEIYSLSLSNEYC